MRSKDVISQVAREGAARYLSTQLDILSKFASIDCGTQNEAGNQRVVDILEGIFKPMNVRVEHYYAPGFGTHLIVRITPENSEGKILLLAHLDTVFKEGETTLHPFRIEGDWAHGLGVADCKGGLLTAIFGVKIMQEANMLPNKELIFLLNCDEEMGSPASKEIFRKEVVGADFAFAFEPTREQNGLYTYRAGVAEGTIHITGKSAHAQINYFEGSSATVELANLILKLIGKNDVNKGILYNIAPINGGEWPVMVADKANATFSVALTSAEAIEQVKRDVEELNTEGIVKGCQIETNLNILWPPMERTEGNQKAYELVKSAGVIMGLELPEGSTMGSGDICSVSNLGVASVDCLGPYMFGIHTVNERVRISSIAERTELFSILLGII